MKAAQDIIIKPIITEESMTGIMISLTMMLGIRACASSQPSLPSLAVITS